MPSVNRLSRLLDLLAQDPRNPLLLADIADEQLQLGEWKAARSTLTQLLEIQPKDPLARYRLAVAERASDDATQAQQLLQTLVDDGHAHPAVLQELARCHALLGNWGAVPSTLASLDASNLPPEESDAIRLLRIRAHHHLGVLEDALAEARSWQSQRGSDLPLQGKAAIATLLLDAELPDEAARLLAQVAPTEIESNAELATSTGFVELGNSQLASALKQFSRSVDMHPQMGRAHLGLGLTLAAQGDVSKAIEALKGAVEVAPNHLGSWHALAWMQLLSKEVDGAAASFEAALSQDENFGESHGGMALIAALRGDKETSERFLRTAAKLDALSMNVMVTRTVLECGPGALDAEVLSQALDRFTRLGAKRNPAIKAMLARLVDRTG